MKSASSSSDKFIPFVPLFIDRLRECCAIHPHLAVEFVVRLVVGKFAFSFVRAEDLSKV